MPNKRKIRLQAGLAIASFSIGSIIAMVCLFVIPPLGEIATTAISIVSEFLVLCGALLGIDTSFDLRLRKFEHRILTEARKDGDE